MAEHGPNPEHGGGGGHGGGAGFLGKLFTEVIEGAAELGWETGLKAPTEATDTLKDIVATGKPSKGGGGGGAHH